MDTTTAEQTVEKSCVYTTWDCLGHTWHAVACAQGLVFLQTHPPTAKLWQALAKFGPNASLLPSHLSAANTCVQAIQHALHAYANGQNIPLPLAGVSLVLNVVGTPFQQAVWQQLLAVPHGTTTTYGQLAKQIGQPKAAQAVGQAVGANPIWVAVPCHRVLGANRQLTGYAGGLPLKQQLLGLEGQAVK
jgi:O-6-methylguanine DNA methyltransferase